MIRHARLDECIVRIIEVNCITNSQTLCSGRRPSDREPFMVLPALNGLAAPSKLYGLAQPLRFMFGLL